MTLLLSGCFWGGDAGPSGSAGAFQGDETCLRTPSRCIYEGRYESGERDYAEDAARRLNQAQLQRLRRAGG